MVLLKFQVQFVRVMIQYISYSDRLKQHFAKLNYEWLEKYFYVEDYDKEVLENPKAYIIDQGGQIFFAQAETEIIGTVALIKRGANTFELSKMAVTPKFQGQKIGKGLIEVALNYSRSQKMKRVILDSNRKLKPALALYSKMGFKEIPTDPNTPYERCNIRMERLL